MAESNDAGSKTGSDGTAAGNADYITKADFEAFVATITKSLAGIPNMVNKAAQDHTGRHIKALGLTPEAVAKLTAPPKTEGEGDGEGDEADPPKPKGKGSKQPEAQAQQSQTLDIEALLKKQAADFEKQIKATRDGLTKELSAERQKREAAERARIESESLANVKSALTSKLRIKPDMAADYLTIMRSRGALTIGDDGTVTVKVGDEEHGLETGLEAFAKNYTGTPSFQQPPESPKRTPPRPPPVTPSTTKGTSSSIGDTLVAAAASQGLDVYGTIQGAGIG